MLPNTGYWSLLLVLLGAVFTLMLGISFWGTDSLFKVAQNAGSNGFETTSLDATFTDKKGNSFVLNEDNVVQFCEGILGK